ncbi:hypothetical protein N7493_001655 [Penicillium malachiteum]|uniref:SnoaL-like domain-containing protein n=1 Tax=Penicillium malachiteum TaxID=1324776 RepID=A0AAD6HVL1_9EURO|nr:hypothetical protein N7493_001655 [Penicillium malachiteum]
MTDLNKPGTIERTIALSEINAIVNRYCILARENAPWDEMTKLFEHDAIFRLPNGIELSPQNMSAVVGGMEAKYIRHHITSCNVYFTSPTEASVESFFIAVTDWAVIDHWGGWKDEFRKQEDGSWLIRDKTIVVDGRDPDGWSTARAAAGKKQTSQ